MAWNNRNRNRNRSRDRAKLGLRPLPFNGAQNTLRTMERAMAARAVADVTFTLMDMVKWLWPAAVTEPLIRAYPYAKKHISSCVVTTPDYVTPDNTLTFFMELEGVMVPPSHGLMAPSEEGAPLYAAIADIKFVHEQFNKVRTVIEWMDAHATPGACRFYFPGMCVLLPSEHAINKADGQRYREPKEPMAMITPLLREVGAIVAGAVLAGYATYDPPIVRANVTFSGSQSFRIL